MLRRVTLELIGDAPEHTVPITLHNVHPNAQKSLAVIVVGCGVVWCELWCELWCGVVWCGVVWCGVVRSVML